LKKVGLLIGIVLVLAGIVSEAMYITTSNVAYANTLATNSYMVLGILAIIIGLIFTVTSTKMGKFREQF
jgi:uncharacterized membrane protein YdcZ (DUF606 family)